MPETPDNQAPQASPAQPYTPPPVPPYQPAAFPPPKQGPSVLKIMLIIVGIFVGLGLIGVGILSYGVYKVAKTAHITSNSSQPITESDLGVAIYPGAEQGKGGLRMTIAGKSVVTGSYLTSDSKDQVLAFYQSKLGSDAQTRASGDRETLFLKKGSGESVSVTVSQRPNVSGGKTEIVIAHAKDASSPNSN